MARTRENRFQRVLSALLLRIEIQDIGCDEVIRTETMRNLLTTFSFGIESDDKKRWKYFAPHFKSFLIIRLKPKCLYVVVLQRDQCKE